MAKQVVKRKVNRSKRKLTTPAQTVSNWDKICKFLTKGYTIVGVIVAIIGWFTIPDIYHKLVTSKHDLFIEEEFIDGIFIPDEIIHYQKHINILVGSINLQRSMSEMLTGTEISANEVFGCKNSTEDPWHLKLSIIKNRLTVTTDFSYIQDGSMVGKIVENRWLLRERNVFDYYDSDNILEVQDASQNVIFRLEFIHPNSLIYKGYFVGSDNVSVTTDTLYPCIPKSDPLYKENVTKKIRQLKPIYIKKQRNVG